MAARKDRRPYITVTNELFRHPKWTGLPNDKTRLYLIELWGHCNEFRTDGLVVKHVLNARGAAVGKALISMGWVETTNDPNTFRMHDYLAHQPSKAEIEDRIEDKKSGGKLGAHRRWHVEREQPSEDCHYCRDGIA